MKRAALLTGLLGSLFIGCGGDDENCVSATNGQLCGARAISWCDETDRLRNVDDDSGDAEVAAVKRTRVACDRLRDMER